MTMAHDRDHDHPPPAPAPAPKPKIVPPLVSKTKPDRPRPDHPTLTPREPVDPRPHPSRRVGTVALRARPQ